MDKQEELLLLIETGKPLEIKRAIAIHMSIQGFTRAEIANALDVSIQFVDKWKPIYYEQGVKGLKLKYKGSEGYLSKEERQSIIEYIQFQETITSFELKEYIKNQYGVEYNSPKSYTDLLHEAKFSYKKTQKVNPKGDIEQIEAKKKRFKHSFMKTKKTLKMAV